MGYLVLLICGGVGRFVWVCSCFYPWIPHLSIHARKEIDLAGELRFFPAVVE